MFSEAIPIALQFYLGKPDERTSKWIFLNTPLSLFAILLVYFVVLAVLHHMMKRRKAMNLKLVLIGYNAFQVLFSAFICKEVFMSAYEAGYKISCTVLDTKTKLGMRMATAFWYFYVSKIVDLTDTIFFVLRKKHEQLTFLHMYHHSTMIINWYAGALYSPGGQASFSVILNSFVHIIMYLYYMLSAIGPKVRKYLWWKRYLTQIQLVQFVLVIGHLLIGLYTRCKAPFWLNWFTITYVLTLVILFCNFYCRSYKKRLEKKTVIEKVDYRAAGDFKYD